MGWDASPRWFLPLLVAANCTVLAASFIAGHFISEEALRWM